MNSLDKNNLIENVDSLIDEASKTAEKAHKLGLAYAGYGKWKNKTGKVVAKTVDNKLVMLKAPAKSVKPAKSAKAKTKPALKNKKDTAYYNNFVKEAALFRKNKNFSMKNKNTFLEFLNISYNLLIRKHTPISSNIPLSKIDSYLMTTYRGVSSKSLAGMIEAFKPVHHAMRKYVQNAPDEDKMSFWSVVESDSKKTSYISNPVKKEIQSHKKILTSSNNNKSNSEARAKFVDSYIKKNKKKWMNKWDMDDLKMDAHSAFDEKREHSGLLDIIEEWQGDGIWSQHEKFRKHAFKTINNAIVPNKKLFIKTKNPIYRGLDFGNKKTLDLFMKSFKSGKDILLPPCGFSMKAGVAGDFVGGSYSVYVRLHPKNGKIKGAHISGFGFQHEAEVIRPGRIKTKVKQIRAVSQNSAVEEHIKFALIGKKTNPFFTRYIIELEETGKAVKKGVHEGMIYENYLDEDILSPREQAIAKMLLMKYMSGSVHKFSNKSKDLLVKYMGGSVHSVPNHPKIDALKTQLGKDDISQSKENS